MRGAVAVLAVAAVLLGSGAQAGQSENLQYKVRGSAIPMPRESLNVDESFKAPKGALTWRQLSIGCDTPQKRATASLHVFKQPGKCYQIATGSLANYVPDAGRAHLREVMRGNATFAHFHGWGTSSTAASATDTGCLTELSAGSPPNYTAGVRATGSQVAGSTDYIFETSASNQVTASGSVNLREFCLMTSATVGAGTIWSRIVLSSNLNVLNGQWVDTTYRLTITQ